MLVGGRGPASSVHAAPTSASTSTRQLDNLTIDELVFLPGRATYFGYALRRPACAAGHHPDRARGLGDPDRRSVNGADAVVWHLDRETRTIGIPPALRPGQPAWPRRLDRAGHPRRPGGVQHRPRHRRRGGPAARGPRGGRAVGGSHRRPRLERTPAILPCPRRPGHLPSPTDDHHLVARRSRRGRLATWAAATASTASPCSASTPRRSSSRAPVTRVA